ncbi:hypothetical protein J6590_063008 [Homalodisca vitripennis]|nr:hypothetical protein J6590_063008 [Homalodisca vitripennis]
MEIPLAQTIGASYHPEFFRTGSGRMVPARFSGCDRRLCTLRVVVQLSSRVDREKLAWVV